MTRRVWVAVLTVTVIIVAVAVAVYVSVAHRRHSASLDSRLENIVTAEGRAQTSCTELTAKHPLVLLALGQSNAGNHGELIAGISEPVIIFAEGKCFRTTDPLPGGTGRGGSIWQRVPALLLPLLQGARPIVLSVLAVDATAIEDWTNPRSPLRSRLVLHVASLNKQGLEPSLILWQQGEADARLGTDTSTYFAALGRLATILEEAGSSAPIVLARSTLCGSAQGVAIRQAIEEKVTNDRRFRLGPDTDILSGEMLRNGCHLSSEGLDGAAKMWATSIAKQIMPGQKLKP